MDDLTTYLIVVTFVYIVKRPMSQHQRPLILRVRGSQSIIIQGPDSSPLPLHSDPLVPSPPV